jgi:hypothetical protein
MSKTNWKNIQEYANVENKNFFFLCADPKSDEIFVSFNGSNAFVKFPFVDMANGVVFNALRQSKFKEAIDAFMTGIIESTGIDVKNKEGNEFLKVIGGGIKALGVDKSDINNKKNVKIKK